MDAFATLAQSPLVAPDPSMVWNFNNGLAVVMIAVLLLFGWAAARWFGTSVMTPMRDAAVKYVSDMGDTMKTMGSTVSKLGDTLNAVAEGLKQVNEKTDRLLQASQASNRQLRSRLRRVELGMRPCPYSTQPGVQKPSPLMPMPPAPAPLHPPQQH